MEKAKARIREGRDIATDGDCRALVHLFTAMTSGTTALLGLEDEGLPSPVSQGQVTEKVYSVSCGEGECAGILSSGGC